MGMGSLAVWCVMHEAWWYVHWAMQVAAFAWMSCSCEYSNAARNATCCCRAGLMAVQALLHTVRSMRMSGLGGMLQGGNIDPKMYVLSLSQL